MNIYVSISAIPLQDGRFLPRFQFIETQGVSTTFIPYDMSIESACDSEEIALENAKIHAARQALTNYGKDVKLFMKMEQ